MKLLIGNDFSEDVRTDRGWTGWWVQRIVWFARAGDVVVLPCLPDRDFFTYALAAQGLRREDISVIAAAPERDSLTPAVLADPEFVHRISHAIGGRDIDEVLPLWPDAAVAALARDLNVESVLPGAGFMSQAGGLMVNSKSAFRMVATGVGAPVPPGAVCTTSEVAVATTIELLDQHDSVIVKHDWMSGGRGNEILTTRDRIRPIGARRSVHIGSDADVVEFYRERWFWLSSGGRARPVVEHYFDGSSAYFTEFQIDDDGVAFRGDGELLSAPYAVGQLMPAPLSGTKLRRQLHEGSRRIAEALRAIGYRGNIGPDAIVTPDQRLFFTEWNGRITGSTHIYEEIGRQLVGARFGQDRLILERVWPRGWLVTSFADALAKLEDAGLAFDQPSASGVILTNAFDREQGVMYCIAAANAGAAWEIDRQLASVFKMGEQR